MRITIIGGGIVGLVHTAHALLDERARRHSRGARRQAGASHRRQRGLDRAHRHHAAGLSQGLEEPPRWMMDPLGPLTIRPGYLPHLAPWLARFLLASSPTRIQTSIAAIRSINAEALPAWKSLLSSLRLNDHLRSAGSSRLEKLRRLSEVGRYLLASARLRNRRPDPRTGATFATLEPALRNVEAAALYPDACHVSDPAALAADQVKLALERVPCTSRPMLSRSRQANAVHVHTDSGVKDVMSDRVVVSAGVWSRLSPGNWETAFRSTPREATTPPIRRRLRSRPSDHVRRRGLRHHTPRQRRQGRWRGRVRKA